MLSGLVVDSSITDERPAGQPETLSFPRPHWTRLKPGHIFKNILGLGCVRVKDFGPVWVRVCFTGVSYICLHRISGKSEVTWKK